MQAAAVTDATSSMRYGNNINRRKRKHEVLEYDTHQVANLWKPSVSSTQRSRVTAHFDDLQSALMRVISEHGAGNIVVGCVAWLSHPGIIRALGRCSHLLLMVNDEDYSRWGGGRCAALYDQLPVFTESPASVFGHISPPMRLLGAEGYAPVHALGRSDGNALMHSKFLVFLAPACEGVKPTPHAVWTGSMNFTAQSGRNQENALFIEDPTIATGYFHDFVNSFLQSDPLRTEPLARETQTTPTFQL